jgi:hypothetical protein
VVSQRRAASRSRGGALTPRDRPFYSWQRGAPVPSLRDAAADDGPLL